MTTFKTINNTTFVTTKDFNDDTISQSERFTIESEKEMDTLLNDELNSGDKCNSVEVTMRFRFENEEQKEQIEDKFNFSSCYQIDVDEEENEIELMYSINFEG